MWRLVIDEQRGMCALRSSVGSPMPPLPGQRRRRGGPPRRRRPRAWRAQLNPSQIAIARGQERTAGPDRIIGLSPGES
jgi:hypothetical protein